MMAIKRKIEPGTGIYQRLTVSGGPDPESLMEVAEQIVREHRLDRYLEMIETEAKEILISYQPECEWRGPWPLDSLKDADPVVQDAKLALIKIFAVRSNLDEGDVESAVLSALLLGAVYERMGVRPFEKLVREGKQSEARRSKGGKASKKCIGIELALRHLTENYPKETAKELWKRLEEYTSTDPSIIDGFEIYRDAHELFQCVDRTGHVRVIKFRTFQTYVTRSKENRSN